MAALYLASGDSPAAGKYDLLTVLLHEEGHLLGFDPDVPGYTAHIGTVNGSQKFSGPGFTAELTPAPDDDHLDSGAYPNDLMTAALAPSERRLPSAIDAEVIGAVRNTSADLLVASGGVPVVPPATSQHAADLMAAQLPSNWSSFGTTSVNGGTLVLTENTQAYSGLSESFVVPQGVDTLQFTVLADHLLANANGGLPDAFEAALLDQNGNPVNGSAIGLSNTDAFLNIQSTGQIFFGPGVTVSGRSASGGSGSLSTPITVTEDLSGVAAGTTLTLYFDLLGFGAANSSVTVEVLPDQAPVAQNLTASAQEDGPAATVTASFTDPDVGDTHTFSIDNTGTKGKVTDNGNGTFSYDPNGAFESLKKDAIATDTFKYTVTDAAGASSTATVTVTVTGQDDAPAAANVSSSVAEQGPAVTVSASYTDIDAGDTHSFSIDTTGTKGKVIDNGNGTFSYDPNGAFDLALGTTATDTFKYTVTDGSNASSTATVTITITAAPDQAPVANNITANVDELGPAATVTASYVDNDIGDTHTFSINTTGTKGLVSNNSDGTFSYDPHGAFTSLKAGATATDTFTYTVADAAGASSTAMVTVIITGENEAPAAKSVEANADELGPAVQVQASYTDVDDGDSHTFSIDTTGTKGQVINNNDGTFSYDPHGAFTSLKVGVTATDTFQYTVTDGSNASSTATVTITITGE